MSLLHAGFLLAACFCLAFAAPVDDAVEPMPLADKEDYRLPDTILPSHYQIHLHPYLRPEDGERRFTFDGEVFITIKPQMATNVIKMHSKNLVYEARFYFEKDSTSPMPLPEAMPDNETDIVTYNLSTTLAGDKDYVLHFKYHGTMDDDMHGFYRSSYMDAKNHTKWLGSTQFQTNHARRAFPSFDEPKYKATFQVTIMRHKSMKAVSNTHLISTMLEGDHATDVFNKTPIMSTYLLAFIVSEFNERSNGDFGVIARPEYYDQTEYAFDVGQDILKALDNYLNISYYEMGNNKMHMAAIPDFSAGAMENWGLLTYRERSLLYDHKSTSLSAKQSIAAVIAHEQAHMWFGDLVTCDWWSVTWLNEGFARYFQYYATAWAEPDFHIDQQFVVAQVQSVMGMDSTNNTNPMTDPNTYTPADLGRMFNSISYNKGASFIRMTEQILGKEHFQQSLHEYLMARMYQNALPEHLFDIWKTHWPTGWKDHADPYFTSFTTQVGYPVVHVNLASDGRSVEISQKRFLLKPQDGSDSSLLYTIPITYTHDMEKDFQTTTPKFFLNASQEKHTVSLPTNVSWVIFNIQETGYYRVNYNTMHWHKIHHSLYENDWGGIHELNRAQIVDDLFNLARAGEIEYNLALDVLEYLETETHYSPWTAAFNGFNYLTIRLGTDTENFGSYIRQLTEKGYKMLGFDERANDTSLDIYNRANVLSWSCRYGNTDCIRKANDMFHDWHSTGTEIPVNIRSVVYCSAMRSDDGHHFDILFEKYQKETVATEETLILNSLGCVKHPDLIEKFFNIIISDAVRRQDKSAALSSLYTSNNENVWPVYKLVTGHYHELAKAMGDYSAVASVISNLAARFTEDSQQQDLKKFNADNGKDFGSSVSTLNSAERTVEENLAWAKSKLTAFTEYLDLRTNNSPSADPFTILTLVLVTCIAMLLR